jgi:hypothetical protein
MDTYLVEEIIRSNTTHIIQFDIGARGIGLVRCLSRKNAISLTSVVLNSITSAIPPMMTMTMTIMMTMKADCHASPIEHERFSI